MEYKNVSDLYLDASKYELASTPEIVNLFKDAHIFFPDFINRFILLNVLKKHILNSDQMALFPIEFTYKLKNYNYFSNYLLINTVEKYNISIDPKEYKNMFFRFYLKNQKKFKSSPEFAQKLESYKGKIGPTENIVESLKAFQELFYTPKGYLDGLSLSILKDAVNQTFNIADIEALAKKCNVEIPKRVNKGELISIVSSRLLLTDEEKEILSKKPITEITQYSKQKGFKFSPDLKKLDMVEYLVYTLGKYHEDTEKDLYNYEILVDSDNLKETVEQVAVEQTNDSIPVSSNMVEGSYEEKLEEKPKEVEPKPVVKEEIKEEIKIEVSPISNELKEDMDNVLYYDTQVDQEIRDIIKKYYNKKKAKDSLFKSTIIILLLLILVVATILLLKMFKIF